MSESAPCSVASLAVFESMIGSAPYAVGWIAIEQLGPYGRDALTQSHLPPDVGARLGALATEHDLRPELIRPVGRHADTHHDEPRTVFLACSRPGMVAMSRLMIRDLEALFDIDFAALAAGAMSSVHPAAEPVTEPILLMCTHAKRDVCCARLGRPVAEALTANVDLSSTVWECSHLGGHRFAPTAVQLPHGWVHGRLSASTAADVLRNARVDRVPLESVRGRSSLTPAEQVVDVAYRDVNGLQELDSTSLVTDDSGAITVTADGQAPMSAVVTTADSGNFRAESCGKDVTKVTGLTLRWL